jgi:hypothetical protein
MNELFTWMMAGGARRDDPDPRTLAHLVALREAKREVTRDDSRTSPLAWLAERLGLGPQTHTAPDPTTQCCAA